MLLLFMALLFSARSIVLAVIDPSYPALIGAIVPLIVSVGGMYLTFKKMSANERKNIERERELAILTAAELSHTKIRNAELERSFSDHKEQTRQTMTEFRNELASSAERVRNLEHENQELHRRVATQASLLTEIGVAIRDDGIKSVRLEAIYSEWTVHQRRIREGLDTP
jgi:hypothetical protein